MEIENEVAKTKQRINLLEHQNDSFKALLAKALEVTLKDPESSNFETRFVQESIEVIEQEKEKLKKDLSTLYCDEESNIETLLEKSTKIEKLLESQQKVMEHLKCENAEIKFLLVHPESRNAEWLKSILTLDNELSSPAKTSLVEERFRLQRKILDLEKKKAEMLTTINNIAIPDNNLGNYLEKDDSKTIGNDDLLSEYEELRFTMLNLEDERSRLLNDLQCILDMSKREIAEEYKNLQQKILTAERQKASLKLCLKDPSTQIVTSSELENIFSSFRNLSITELEEKAREERVKTEVGTMFCPGLGLPMYCCIM